MLGAPPPTTTISRRGDSSTAVGLASFADSGELSLARFEGGYPLPLLTALEEVVVDVLDGGERGCNIVANGTNDIGGGESRNSNQWHAPALCVRMIDSLQVLSRRHRYLVLFPSFRFVSLFIIVVVSSLDSRYYSFPLS